MVVLTTGFGLVALELVIACTDYWVWCTPEQGKAECKVRGFTLNVRGKKVPYLVWFSTSNIGQRVQLVLDWRPTGSGKTLVATVQCNTGIGGSCLFQRYL